MIPDALIGTEPSYRWLCAAKESTFTSLAVKSKACSSIKDTCGDGEVMETG